MNKLTHATVGLLERRWLKSAAVLAIRTWEPATLLEIDLHMPDCDMSKWQQAQHMKCKVGPLAYRDYTPSGWDAETRTCTLFIDAGHEGQGSRWVKGLRPGDTVSYLGIGSSHHQPAPGKRLVFLGDETALGHFLSLRQLAGEEARIDGAITMAHQEHQHEFSRYFSGLGLRPLGKDSSGDSRELEEWVADLDPADDGDTVFYLAGYIPAVVRLRKLLKGKGYSGSQVRCQGFWD
jgi:NADPH-dependent ferric siderophore reductase